MLGAFSDLHRKMSVRWVGKMASLKHTSENARSLYVSPSSVFFYYAYGYCPSRTSETVLKLIHQVFYCTDIGKSLITCIHAFFALQFHDGAGSNFQASENVWDLTQVAPPTETDVFCLACTHVCPVHRFLSVLQLRSDFSPFSVSDEWRTM